MVDDISLDALWASAPAGERRFQGGAGAPEPVRRYLSHAIAPGTVLANAVRLRMHGEIRLGKWRRFRAEQVITIPRGMMWCATTRFFGLPVSGFDRFLDGTGEMRWKMPGRAAPMSASGPDVSRSAAGRLAAESMWLPSLLCQPSVAWNALDDSHIVARLPLPGETPEVLLRIDANGQLQQTSMSRWGNPNGAPFDYRPFGGFVEEERTFGGYTIPTRVRAGWYFGSPRFNSDGEFFRCTIEEATFR